MLLFKWDIGLAWTNSQHLFLELYLFIFAYSCTAVLWSQQACGAGSGAGCLQCIYKRGCVQVRLGNSTLTHKKAGTQMAQHSQQEHCRSTQWNANNNGWTSRAAPEMFQQALFFLLDSSVTNNWAFPSGFLIFPDGEEKGREAMLWLVNTGMAGNTCVLHCLESNLSSCILTES